eukprot:gene1729-1989_t
MLNERNYQKGGRVRGDGDQPVWADWPCRLGCEQVPLTT